MYLLKIFPKEVECGATKKQEQASLPQVRLPFSRVLILGATERLLPCRGFIFRFGLGSP